MTRDSAAVAALDDRRRRCPISAASNVVDDASTLMTNSIAMSGSSSNDDVGGGDEGGSLKSSSEVSTTTSCCGGSSSSSRSGSDDDDSATVTRLATAIDDSCSTTIKTSTPLSLHKQKEGDNNGDKDSSSSSHGDEAAVTTTPTNIGGRLTFYKDGKFIFQLAAHHQQNPYNNPSPLTSPCRWVPVPTVIQQHKNNVKCIGEWSQHQQNKTIWPYSATNIASDSNTTQPIQQSQPPTVRICERKQQNFQHRTTPPPLSLITGAVNTVTQTGGIVVATTTNIVRRPSRKCSTTVTAENITDSEHQSCQPPTQLRGLPRRSQQHQHQAFIMVATEAIKVQRRLLSLPKKQRLWCQRNRKSMNKNSLLQELNPPQINLECVIRNLWCRRHTTELLLRRQLSINNSGDNVAANISTVVDITPTVASRHVVVSTPNVDSTCPSIGGSKRRSMVSPSPSTAVLIPITATTMTLNTKSSNSSPHKKYKLGHQQPPEQILPPQRRVAVDKISKKAIPQPSPQVISANDHSITAILSGGATGAKRSSISGAVSMVMDPVNGVVTTATTTSAVLSPHKNLHTPSSAPLSLLRTLLKSPSCESGSSPIASNSNGVGYRTNSSRKRSSVESTTVSSTPSINAAAIKVENGLGTPTIAIPSIGGNAADNTSSVLTALHQLPTIHHPAAGQLAAAGYFNVLYHRAAMAAAAMAYQTNAQLSQPLPKSQPPSLLSSQFPITGGASSTWQRQLNRRPPLVHPPEAIVGSGVTNASISSSTSTVVAPYSSPLVASTVNGSSLLAPATPSPPPPPLMLHPNPVHRHHLLLHHQQQYQPVPTIQQQPSSFHQFNHRQQGSSFKKRSGVAIGATEYGVCIEENNSGVIATPDEESSSSADCMPLNLSKDSITENVSGTSPTARVR